MQEVLNVGYATDVAQLNRVLKWIGLEMVSPDEVRSLPDPRDPLPVRRPVALLGVSQDPNTRGGYSLSQAPQLARIVRAFQPLGNPLWRENPLPDPGGKRAILDALRGQMENAEDTKTASHGRILATTLYWNAVKSLRLTPAEARYEAASLRAVVAARRSAADVPSQEIARNAGLALGVLIENYPNAK